MNQLSPLFFFFPPPSFPLPFLPPCQFEDLGFAKVDHHRALRPSLFFSFLSTSCAPCCRKKASQNKHSGHPWTNTFFFFFPPSPSRSGQSFKRLSFSPPFPLPLPGKKETILVGICRARAPSFPPPPFLGKRASINSPTSVSPAPLPSPPSPSVIICLLPEGGCD